ncbi:MAG: tripartite tricarboxylate transporter substrate binding protein [Pseudorhodoplanes sp.]
MRRILSIAAVLLGSLTTVQAQAPAQTPPQSWPQRNVTLILPLGPGSGVDITSRLLAEKLSAKWGKPVVIENRPGGDAIVAINAFLSANDDHTFFMAPTSTFTAHPFIHSKLPYQPEDLVPIARVTNTLIAVGVPASLGVNTLDEFVKLAKEKPGQLNWAGTTGAVDFMTAGFLKAANIDVTKVPYKDGVQALNDLAEGRIQLYGAAYAIMRPQVQAGKVKVLALLNKERAPQLPDVPTAIEAKHPAFAIDGLVGMFGNRNLSPELRDRISADVVEAAKDPSIEQKLAATGQVVRPGGAKEFSAEIEDQRARIAEAAKNTGIKPTN